jgi:hypothetical protein
MQLVTRCEHVGVVDLDEEPAIKALKESAAFREADPLVQEWLSKLLAGDAGCHPCDQCRAERAAAKERQRNSEQQAERDRLYALELERQREQEELNRARAESQLRNVAKVLKKGKP